MEGNAEIMFKDSKVLELYAQRREEGLAALGAICGYAELLSTELLWNLTDEQHSLVEKIKTRGLQALALWCIPAVGIDLVKDLSLEQGSLEAYRALQHEALIPLTEIKKGYAWLLLQEDDLTKMQRQVIKVIIQQCEQAIECLRYPAQHQQLHDDLHGVD